MPYTVLIWGLVWALGGLLGSQGAIPRSILDRGLSDPEPAPRAKVADRHVAFTKVGETTATLKYAGVNIDFDITSIEKTAHILYQEVRPVRSDFNDEQYRLWIGRRVQLVKNRAMRIRQFFINAETMEGHSNDYQVFQKMDSGRSIGGRQKRFIFTAIALLIAAVAATATGIGLAYYEINRQQTKLAELGSAMRDVSNNEHMLGMSMAEMNRYISDTLLPMRKEGHKLRVEEEIVDYLERRIDFIERAFDLAVQGKVSHALLTQIDLTKTAKVIRTQAKRLAMVPIAKFASDWLAFDCSWVATDKGFSVILHVPLMPRAGSLTVYRFDAMPIPVADKVHLMIHASEKKYIAIDATRSKFRTLSNDELQDCRKVGGLFLCDRGNVVRRAPTRGEIELVNKRVVDPDLCLFALITQKYQLASATCEMDVGRPSESVQMLGSNRFIVYSKEPHQAAMHCRDSASPALKTITLQGLQTVDLPANCWADTDLHTFEPSDEMFTRAADEWNVVYEWPQPKELLQEANSDKIKENFDRLFRNSSRPIALTTALESITQWQERDGISHGTLTAYISLLCSVLACGISVMLWKKWLKKNKNSARATTRTNEFPMTTTQIVNVGTESDRSSAPPRYTNLPQVPTVLGDLRKQAA